MYQDSGGLEDTEYQMMYEQIKLSQEAGSLKLGTVVEHNAMVDSALQVTQGADEAGTGSVTMNPSVAASVDQVMEGALVASGMDAVVNSMVTPANINPSQTTITSDHKPQQQVIVKLEVAEELKNHHQVATLFNQVEGGLEETFTFDMVRIIVDQDTNESPSPSCEGFEVLERIGSACIENQNKLSSQSSSNTSEIDFSNAVEKTVSQSLLAGNTGDNSHCNVVWTCSYCKLVFPSSDAVTHHHETDCKGKPNQSLLDTGKMTLKSSLEASPSDLEIDADNENSSLTIDCKSDKEEDANCETTWNCAVCGGEFGSLSDLSVHHMTHSIGELSSALIRKTLPQQKVKKKDQASNPKSKTEKPAPKPVSPEPSSKTWDDDNFEWPLTREEEEAADNPCPVSAELTPPKNKPGPKPKPREKREKRKYVRRLGPDGLPVHKRKFNKPTNGPGSREPHQCQVCNKVLSSRGNLAKHMVQHEALKPWICKVCGLGFNSKRDRDLHYMIKHTLERPHTCHLCGKGFVHKRYLAEHLNFHSKDKTFMCEVCGKHFISAKCVKRHLKRHEEKRPFLCFDCPKAFICRGDLTSHMRKVHKKLKRGARCPDQHMQEQQQQQQQQEQQQQQQQQPQHEQQQISVQQQQLNHNLETPGASQHLHQSQVHKQEENHQHDKKELANYILPHSAAGTSLLPDQILPTDLDSSAMAEGTQGTKESIFITGDPLTVPTLVPISSTSETSGCMYGVTLSTPSASHSEEPLSSSNNHGTYIMINSLDDDGCAQAIADGHSLNIMYTSVAATGPTSRPVASIVENALDALCDIHSSVTHHNQPTAVSNSIQQTSALTQQPPSSLHSVTPQDNAQGIVALTAADTSGLQTHQLVADDSDRNSLPPRRDSQDQSQNLHLELLSNSIELDLQRSDTGTNAFL